MRNTRRVWRSWTAVIPLVAVAAATLPAGAQVQSPYHPRQVILRFKPGVTDLQKHTAILGARGLVRKELRRALDGDGDETVYVISTDFISSDAANYLRTLPTVATAEPDGVCFKDARPGGGGGTTTAYVANDPYFTNNSQWGAYGDVGAPKNAYGSQAAEAWIAGRRGSSTAVVAMIDAGVDTSHPDLAANIWTNPGEIANNGVDDDGNGYVDDLRGWDFANDDKTTFDSGDDGHGTHVAGILGAIGNNGAGVAGICWQVKIIPCKFLGAGGGSTSDAVAALNYLIDLKARYGLKLIAVNSSWGTGAYSQALHDAVIRAAKAGILVVATAGNTTANTDTTPRYPACHSSTVATSTETAATFENVLSVASIGAGGVRSSFSSYGKVTCDLFAPGENIMSTLPGNAYGTMSGTSMAAPHVAGAATLYASSRATATAASIRSAVMGTLVKSKSYTNYLSGGGRLNATTF